MAEYGREQRTKLSRTVAYGNYSGINQLYLDNRLQAISQGQMIDVIQNKSHAIIDPIHTLKCKSSLSKLIQLTPFDKGRPIGTDRKNREFHSKIPERTGKQFFFRAVTQNEYSELVNTGIFTRKESYQGISPNVNYVANYFGINQNHHIIEFEVQDEIDLISEFAKAGTGIKNEGVDISLGIGSKATPVEPNAIANGGDYFMYCMQARSIRWRLTRYIGVTPPSVYRG